MTQPIRLGIIGPGRIASKFCDSLRSLGDDVAVYAVASRNELRAKEFANKFGAVKVHSSYEALAADSDVNVVYIATPHPFHFDQASMCLKNRKPVICEKPMTISFKQTSELVMLARKNNTFLMEAMWSRFIPANVKMKQMIDAGTIGNIKFIHADFGFIAPSDLTHRTFSKSLGGGAQLDVGVYPMFLILWLLGKPKSIKAFASIASTGVDDNTTALFGFENGAGATIHSSFLADSVKEAVITGTLGTITIHPAWHKSTSFSVKKNGVDTIEKLEFPYDSNGLQFQVIEAIQCLREGKKESSKLPLSMSLLMAETADEILKQVGVSYD